MARAIDERTARAVPAGAWLGVLGGGQLGRMFVHAAQQLGFKVLVLEPDPGSPAAAAADRHLMAPYTDTAALDALAATCAAVTTEFENVPADALARLAATGISISPAAAAVQVCQHRAREKSAFANAAVPCAPHALIESMADIERVIAHNAHDAHNAHSAHIAHNAPPLFPGILKTASLGYDGKGQRPVADAASLRDAWASLGAVPCVLEKRLALQQEISVVVARSAGGQLVHLPVQQNLHRDGVLAVTQVPAPDVRPALADEAVNQAGRMAIALDYVGVLCVEFFIVDDGTPGGALVANEMAPRPHNSGHWSIDGSDVSQFDLQVRCMAGLPLPTPRLHSSAVMLNLLGELWFDAQGNECTPPWTEVLALPGAHLHLYGKAGARRGRKMGHVTITGDDAAGARAVALQVAALLGLPLF